jgi:ketosteroid isomerase-like protein
MSKAIRQQVLRAEREQARAINRGNIRAALKMFHKDFVGFSSTRHKRIRGLRALEKTFHYYLKRAPRITYRIEQAQVHTIGLIAVATFYWTVGLSKGRSVRGRGTHVFVRTGKGWRVVHEHFSRAR